MAVQVGPKYAGLGLCPTSQGGCFDIYFCQHKIALVNPNDLHPPMSPDNRYLGLRSIYGTWGNRNTAYITHIFRKAFQRQVT